jgi:glycosyltransferase involved in cell wall biosynthesis
MKRVLMVAYHFPPLAGSSGIQRTLRFAQHLPAVGWMPIILTAHPRAYERTSGDLDAQLPAGVLVKRAFALDTARHLSVRGRYLLAMSRPDRWVSWRFGAVRDGMRLIREHKPDLIWSTYPIATAHLIGAELARRSGLPWVADFRDPMAQDGYPADPATWQQFKAIEQSAMRHAALNVFTTPGAARHYRDCYPEAEARIAVVGNGYDEESFVAAERSAVHGSPLKAGRLTLLHSGIVYPSERDPTHLFEALGRLRQAGLLDAMRLNLRFRAAEHVELLERLTAQHGLAPYVELCPPVPYLDALREMLSADALLVMQGSGCNDQIPAKVYEYLRARRPVLGLVDPQGDTAALLEASGVEHCAHLSSTEAIASVLPRFIDKLAAGAVAPPRAGACSRRERAADLACLMDRLKVPPTRSRSSSPLAEAP